MDGDVDLGTLTVCLRTLIAASEGRHVLPHDLDDDHPQGVATEDLLQGLDPVLGHVTERGVLGEGCKTLRGPPVAPTMHFRPLVEPPRPDHLFEGLRVREEVGVLRLTITARSRRPGRSVAQLGEQFEEALHELPLPHSRATDEDEQRMLSISFWIEHHRATCLVAIRYRDDTRLVEIAAETIEIRPRSVNVPQVV